LRSARIVFAGAALGADFRVRPAETSSDRLRREWQQASNSAWTPPRCRAQLISNIQRRFYDGERISVPRPINYAISSSRRFENQSDLSDSLLRAIVASKVVNNRATTPEPAQRSIAGVAPTKRVLAIQRALADSVMARSSRPAPDVDTRRRLKKTTTGCR
jgi:hypothetical protein